MDGYMLRKWLRRILTKSYYVHARDVRSKKAKRVQIPPNEKLVYGMYFAIITLLSFTALEITYMVVFHQWNIEIFSAITGLSGTILGLFLGAKA